MYNGHVEYLAKQCIDKEAEVILKPVPPPGLYGSTDDSRPEDSRPENKEFIIKVQQTMCHLDACNASSQNEVIKKNISAFLKCSITFLNQR